MNQDPSMYYNNHDEKPNSNIIVNNELNTNNKPNSRSISNLAANPSTN